MQWPDTHVPYHHRGAVERLTRFVGEVQPAELILTGDLPDCESPARFSAGTVVENGVLLARELDATRGLLCDIRDVYDGPMAWLEGNHELRLTKWGQTRGRAVFGLAELTIPHLLGFDDLRITTPGGYGGATKPYRFAPGVVALHGTRLGAKSGYSVAKEMELHGSSVVMGHCHRLALIFRSDTARTTWGIEGGHLMDQRRASYLLNGAANWQMGFSVIDVRGGRAYPYIVPMGKDGSFVFQGEAY